MFGLLQRRKSVILKPNYYENNLPSILEEDGADQLNVNKNNLGIHKIK